MWEMGNPEWLKEGGYLIGAIFLFGGTWMVTHMAHRSDDPQPEEEHCPVCGEVIETVFMRCPQCGHWLKQNCPDCGKVVETHRKCCPHCENVLEFHSVAGDPEREVDH